MFQRALGWIVVAVLVGGAGCTEKTGALGSVDGGMVSDPVDSGVISSSPDGGTLDGSIVRMDGATRLDASTADLGIAPWDGHVSTGDAPCACANASDSCAGTGASICYSPATTETGLPACVDDTIVCNALTACPTGYRCTGSEPGLENRCVCDDLTICGPVCSASGDCPCGLTCGASNHCLPCAFSEQCPSGRVCRRGACITPPPPGTAMNGTSCGEDAECAGSACVFRTCTQQCGSNGECPAGLVCAESDNLQHHGCVVPQVTSCTSGCTDPAAICAFYDTPAGHCSIPCARESDCATGRCLSDTDKRAHWFAAFLLYRVCSTGPPACLDFEFEVRRETELFCSQGLSCFFDSDCGSPYLTCLVPDRGGPMERGFCVRTP